MKKLVLSLALAFVSLCVLAQSNPIVMMVNGKAVTRAEFEYAYNKNGDSENVVEDVPLEKYVDMFINYKLKVAEAERLKMDTLSSYIKEFQTYRDMQLTPALVDSAFIDSVAREVYDNTIKSLDGHDLIRTAHILLQVKPKATDAERTAVKQRIDSIYNALKNGADFAELARQFSQDGAARNGGELPFVGPGQLVKEFEDEAYKLKVGQFSKPVETNFGYHIIKMLERKQLEPYEQVRGDIFGMLKQQGIEEASAQKKIEKLMAQRHCTREEVMESVLEQRIQDDPNLQYLVQEYHDGLLLYEVSKQEVWDKADADEAGQNAFYKAHKKDYAWKQPKFKGFVYHLSTNDKKVKKQTEKLLKPYIGTNDNGWRKELKKEVNKDSLVVTVQGPYLCEQGENAFVDEAVFGQPQTKPLPKYPFIGFVGKTQKQPKGIEDVKAAVVADYKKSLEDAWVEGLRQKYSFSVNEAVLKTVNNHD